MSVFVAMPCYGGSVNAETMMSLLACIREGAPVGEVQVITWESLIPRARNVLASSFLRSGCRKLLFVDADIIFTPEDFAHVTGHDEDFVGGLYPLKNPGPIRYCFNGFPGSAPQMAAPNLLHVKYIGTGFLCLTRAVFERVAARWPEDFFRPDENSPGFSDYDWFKAGICDGRYLSEDYLFCDRWNRLGGRVMADTRVRLRHIGRIAYPLEASEEVK